MADVTPRASVCGCQRCLNPGRPRGECYKSGTGSDILGKSFYCLRLRGRQVARIGCSGAEIGRGGRTAGLVTLTADQFGIRLKDAADYAVENLVAGVLVEKTWLPFAGGFPFST